MNVALMRVVEDIVDYVYKDEESKMVEEIGTEEGVDATGRFANYLLKVSKGDFKSEDAPYTGKEVTLASNVLNLFTSAYLFAKACRVVDKEPIESSEFYVHVSQIINRYMECTYLSAAVDRKNAAYELVKKIDEMCLTLSNLLQETIGSSLESISYITATKFMMFEILDEIRTIGVDTVNYP